MQCAINDDLMVPPHVHGRSQDCGGVPLLILIHPVHDGPSFLEFIKLVILFIAVKGVIGYGILVYYGVVHDNDGLVHENYIVLVLEIIHSPFLTPYPGFLYWINKIRYPNGNTLILLQNSTDTIGVLFELVSNYGGI